MLLLVVLTLLITAGRWGGAISASGYLIAGDDVNTLTVSGSTFKENGGLYGAGIFVAGSDFTVSDCVFDKNYCIW